MQRRFTHVQRLRAKRIVIFKPPQYYLVFYLSDFQKSIQVNETIQSIAFSADGRELRQWANYTTRYRRRCLITQSYQFCLSLCEGKP